MDALTLGMFLSPILTVTTVWNTGETGDIHICDLNRFYFITLSATIHLNGLQNRQIRQRTTWKLFVRYALYFSDLNGIYNIDNFALDTHSSYVSYQCNVFL